MTTLAETIRTFLNDRAKHKRLGPELVHDVCNSYLQRLRCGSRRHSLTHSPLRAALRSCRSQAALRIRAGQKL
jgi:hypothetical protein